MSAGFVDATVIARRDWAEGLMSLTLDIVPENMTAGQFVNLGVEEDGKFVRRSYSVASAVGAPLEVYLTLVEGGALTPGLFQVPEGATVPVDPKPHGFFTLQKLPPCKDLWLVGTGTGLGPYVSMLRSGVLAEGFDNVVIVHGVRQGGHLSYREEIEATKLGSGQPVRYVPVVSRDTTVIDAISGRITAALASGMLEERAGIQLHTDAHVMLCGNPAMIKEMIQLLGDRGLKKHRAKEPGHVSFEKYWS